MFNRILSVTFVCIFLFSVYEVNAAKELGSNNGNRVADSAYKCHPDPESNTCLPISHNTPAVIGGNHPVTTCGGSADCITGHSSETTTGHNSVTAPESLNSKSINSMRSVTAPKDLNSKNIQTMGTKGY